MLPDIFFICTSIHLPDYRPPLKHPLCCNDSSRVPYSFLKHVCLVATASLTCAFYTLARALDVDCHALFNGLIMTGNVIHHSIDGSHYSNLWGANCWFTLGRATLTTNTRAYCHSTGLPMDLATSTSTTPTTITLSPLCPPCPLPVGPFQTPN